MYNQQFQGNIGSQSQGYQRQYQPVGNVQSFYGQSQNQQQQYGNYPSSESYHTANYRGNQLGHDQGLRGDSFTPAQQQQGGFGMQAGGMQTGGMQADGMNQTDYSSFRYGVRGNEQAYSQNNNVASQFGFNDPYGASRSTGATSAYGQGSYGQGSYGQGSYGQAAYGQGGQAAYGQGGQAAYGQASYGQGSNPSAEAYHTANYRGNQLGHDQGLRGDSFTPAQQQQGGFGMQSGGSMGTDNSSFRYGVRGNEQAYSQNNNVSQQFGFNNAY